jgi:hypothetical protein
MSLPECLLLDSFPSMEEWISSQQDVSLSLAIESEQFTQFDNCTPNKRTEETVPLEHRQDVFYDSVPWLVPHTHSVDANDVNLAPARFDGLSRDLMFPNSGNADADVSSTIYDIDNFLSAVDVDESGVNPKVQAAATCSAWRFTSDARDPISQSAPSTLDLTPVVFEHGSRFSELTADTLSDKQDALFPEGNTRPIPNQQSSQIITTYYQKIDDFEFPAMQKKRY